MQRDAVDNDFAVSEVKSVLCPDDSSTLPFSAATKMISFLIAKFIVLLFSQDFGVRMSAICQPLLRKNQHALTHPSSAYQGCSEISRISLRACDKKTNHSYVLDLSTLQAKKSTTSALLRSLRPLQPLNHNCTFDFYNHKII
jgi:uncharacterized membrane protein YcgQ (UPF0703/DUF1980 family)